MANVRSRQRKGQHRIFFVGVYELKRVKVKERERMIFFIGARNVRIACCVVDFGILCDGI